MIPIHTPKMPPSILLWVEQGAEPTEKAFDLETSQAPPYPNPEAWWFLSEALECAMTTKADGKNADKEPWIKSGEVYLSPEQVSVMYKTMLAQREKAQGV